MCVSVSGVEDGVCVYVSRASMQLQKILGPISPKAVGRIILSNLLKKG